MQQASYIYNAANEVNGSTYDAAGNLTNDGTTTYGYDALGRLTGTTAGSQSRNYAYNGDGTLVSASVNGASTSYTQDLAGGMSQVLATTSGGVTSDYLRDDGGSLLASLTSGTRTWYGTDEQGSVRQTLDDSADVLGVQSYDPYGNPETSGQVGIFGYTGELQNGSDERRVPARTLVPAGNRHAAGRGPGAGRDGAGVRVRRGRPGGWERSFRRLLIEPVRVWWT